MRRARLSQPVWNFYGLIEQHTAGSWRHITKTYKSFVWLPEIPMYLVTKYILKHVLEIVVINIMSRVERHSWFSTLILSQRVF